MCICYSTPQGFMSLTNEFTNLLPEESMPTQPLQKLDLGLHQT